MLYLYCILFETINDVILSETTFFSVSAYLLSAKGKMFLRNYTLEKDIRNITFSLWFFVQIV